MVRHGYLLLVAHTIGNASSSGISDPVVETHVDLAVHCGMKEQGKMEWRSNEPALTQWTWTTLRQPLSQMAREVYTPNGRDLGMCDGMNHTLVGFLMYLQSGH